MAGRRLRIASRIVFAVCGLVSLVTAVPFAILRGIGLPYQREWAIFVIVLSLLVVVSIGAAVLRRAWIAKICKKDRDDESLFAIPLKLLGWFAAIGYLTGVFAYLAPHTWNLDPQIMLTLCPMYLLRMTFDPSPLLIFLLLTPMNAAVFGALGIVVAYARMVARSRKPT